MLEIFLGIVAIGGGLGYCRMGNPMWRLFGLMPIVVFVVPFGMSLVGEMLPVLQHFLVEGSAALLGAAMYQKGRMEKIARVAETGEE